MENAPTSSDSLEVRRQMHDEWVINVRDPSQAANEGPRTIITKNSRALVSYTISQLPSGRFAIKFGMEYVGFAGSYSPWRDFDTREACIDELLLSTRRYFDREIDGCYTSDNDRLARVEMLELLGVGTLFGFVEPEVG